MRIEYLGRDLYNKIHFLVGKAFHYLYNYDEDNWFEIEEIELDYLACDEDDDTPIIKSNVRFHNKLDGTNSITLEYLPQESDDFNIGFMAKEFSNFLDSDE